MSFILCIPHQILFGVFKSKSLRLGVHVENMGRGEVHTGFWWGNLRDENRLKNLGVDGRIILKCIFEKWVDSIEWIDLAQDRDRRRAVVNAVMNLRVL